MGSVIVSVLPPPDSLSELADVLVLVLLLVESALVEVEVEVVSDVDVMSGVEPKPVVRRGNGWQAARNATRVY